MQLQALVSFHHSPSAFLPRLSRHKIIRFQKAPLRFHVNVYAPLNAYRLTRRNKMDAAYIASHCDYIAAERLQ
jgi:hypothetical protein